MATKTKDSSGVGKEKKTSSSNTPTRSTKRSIMAPFISDKPVPNYMNPTISSLPESLKQAILNRPNLDRRRSFDKPPSRLPKLQKQPSPSRQGLVSPSHVPRVRSLKRSNTLPGKCRNIVPSIPNSDRRNSRKSSPTPSHEADSKRPIEEVINVVETEGRNDDHEENSNNASEVEVERVEERPIEEVINVVETDEGRNDHEENSNNNASEVEVERVEENVSQLVSPQDVEQNQNPDIDDHEKVIPPSPLVVSEEQEKIKDDDEHEKEEEQEKIKDDDEHEKEEEQEKIKDDDEHEKEEVQEKIKNDEHEKEEEQEKIKDDEHEKEVEQEKIKDEEHEKEGECINEEINGSTTEGEVDEIKEEKEEGEVVNDDNIIVEEDQKKNEEEEEKEGGTSEGVEVEGEEEEHVESSSEVEEVKVEEESTKPSKKETHSQVSNDVIEETASKLLEERKNKVRALAGAFQTVIDYQTK